MFKKIAVAVVLGVFGSILVAATAGAYPPPIPGCQVKYSTHSDPRDWHFIMSEDWWQAGSYRISMGCNQAVVATSDGWRFDNSQCGQMWVRRQRDDGSTYILPGSVKHICGGGPPVVLASRQPINVRFWVEAWPYDTDDRWPGIWPVVSIRF